MIAHPTVAFIKVPKNLCPRHPKQVILHLKVLACNVKFVYMLTDESTSTLDSSHSSTCTSHTTAPTSGQSQLGTSNSSSVQSGKSKYCINLHGVNCFNK